ncbi:MAG: hypothetical protein ACM687_01345, partial [Bacteroidales bacterium]
GCLVGILTVKIKQVHSAYVYCFTFYILHKVFQNMVLGQLGSLNFANLVTCGHSFLSILNLYKTNYIIFPDELRRIILTMANMSKEIAPKYEKDIHFIINEKNNDLNKAINLMNIFCYTISSYLNEQKKIFEDELCAFVKEEQKRIDSMIFHDLIR